MSPIPGFQSKNYVIIVAGGSGMRMQATVPKQFLLLNGKPVLMHTIAAFDRSETHPQIIVVLHPGFHTYWNQLCKEHNFNIPHQLVSGGETRFYSVKNGLDSINDDADVLVAVHDAVRPLTGTRIIDESYKSASQCGNAVTAVKSRDSIRQVTNGVSKSLIRDEIYLVQTPQTFKLSQLKTAYLQSYNANFTDDASVVEGTGIAINFIEGSYANIKITLPIDIAIAEMIMRNGLDNGS
ncbi:MAG: 2-C-methyl-D-erythritol 4-phosphate cytidylyltransferase [Mucilaginibacter sp.]|nr:2-C-methyl-D-erythritol 4-phosphate cytidylyltransferase [Mucilaginibacter sp.]